MPITPQMGEHPHEPLPLCAGMVTGSILGRCYELLSVVVLGCAEAGPVPPTSNWYSLSIPSVMFLELFGGGEQGVARSPTCD